MSYSFTSDSGKTAVIPTSKDLSGSTLTFTWSYSSSFSDKTDTPVSFTQSSDGVSFTLPTFNSGIYYRLVSTKSGVDTLVTDGNVYKPTPPRASGGVTKDSVTSDSIVDGSVANVDIANLNADKLIEGSTNKLFSASEKTKLAGIASGATANALDSQLRDRSTHTGVQPSNTISGLSTVATSGSYDDLLNKPAAVRQVVEHGSAASTIRPSTSGPVTWIGSVQPINWLDGDDWYEATIVNVDIPTANLVNYWRAEDLTLSNGQTVTTMANRVSGGPALAATGSPVFNVENSMSSVLLDGVDDYLNETTTTLNQPTTVVTVGRFVTVAASKPWFAATSSVQAITLQSTSKWTANAGTSLPHSATADTGWHVAAAVFNGTSTIIYIDGVAVTGSGGTNTRVGSRVGSNSGLSGFTNMKFTMAAMYSTALTTSDLDSIRATLKTRYPVLP